MHYKLLIQMFDAILFLHTLSKLLKNSSLVSQLPYHILL